MSDEPAPPDGTSPAGSSPAGSPAEPRAADRPWRIWASVVVVAALLVAGLLGFVVIPAGQRENAHLDMTSAMRRAAGLEPGSPAVRQPSATSSSLPVSQVSWDPRIMHILASGSTRRGAQLAAETCAACHGEKGLAPMNFPSLAGQTSFAIYKQLHDYRTGARSDPQMTPMAEALSVADLANVAAYFAAASKEYAALGDRDFVDVGDAYIDKLAREGDSRRRLPACLSCHASGSGGPIETPVIVGQRHDYILAQLNAYATGTRKNDIYGRMRQISSRLTPRERDALARYFEGTM